MLSSGFGNAGEAAAAAAAAAGVAPPADADADADAAKEDDHSMNRFFFTCTKKASALINSHLNTGMNWGW